MFVNFNWQKLKLIELFLVVPSVKLLITLNLLCLNVFLFHVKYNRSFSMIYESVHPTLRLEIDFNRLFYETNHERKWIRTFSTDLPFLCLCFDKCLFAVLQSIIHFWTLQARQSIHLCCVTWKKATRAWKKGGHKRLINQGINHDIYSNKDNLKQNRTEQFSEEVFFSLCGSSVFETTGRNCIFQPNLTNLKIRFKIDTQWVWSKF